VRSNAVVAAQVRTARGKNEARRARVSGQIPAVVYGAFKDPVAVSVNPKDILQILHSKSGHNTIFNLNVEGAEQTPVMIVDEQYDPVKSNLLHIDFKRIDPAKRIRVSVPVVTQGEAKGVKTQGGLLEVVNRQIEIESLPEAIPEHFIVDVSELLLGQSKRAGEIALGEGVRLVSPGEAVIAHVVGVKAEEPAPTVEVAPAAGEPEVVKKGKKEDEEAAADKGKKK